MPAPRQRISYTAEQIARGEELVDEAMMAGALDRNGRNEYVNQVMRETGAETINQIPVGQWPVFESIVIDIGRGTIIDQKTYQPISAENWVVDCRSRNVVPLVNR